MGDSRASCWEAEKQTPTPQPSEGWPEIDEYCESDGVEDLLEQPCPSTTDTQNAVQSLTLVVQRLAEKFQAVASLETVRKEIAIINSRLARLEQEAAIVVPIQSLAPEPYEVIKPLLAVIRMIDQEYVASFVDANLGSSGETLEEAILNLKDAIAAGFDVLARTKDSELGPGPLQQKRTLEEFLRRK